MHQGMKTRGRFLRLGRRESEPESIPCDFVPETEAEGSRRYWREWMRDRDDSFDNQLGENDVALS